MATGPRETPEDPRSLLAATRDATRRVRRDQSGGWSALLVFGVLTLLAAPFSRYGPHLRHCAHFAAGAYVCTVYPALALWYWPVALVLGYVAIAWLYRRRSRLRGFGTQLRPYVVIGLLLGLLSASWAVWSYMHPAFLAQSLHVGPSTSSNVLFRLTSPAGAIGLALLVLAWLERDRLLAAVTVVYLAAVGAGSNPSHRVKPTPWVFLPHLLLLTGILFLGACVLGLTRRTHPPLSA